MSRLVQAGNVGVPVPGERICPRCKGAGRAAHETGPMDGCDRCEGTGVVMIRRKRDPAK
jgi:DnaJ-class molecular chaperone